MGIFQGFLDDLQVTLVGVEAGGAGLESGRHAARIASGASTIGVAHGYKTYFLQDEDGQMRDTHSVAAGLDYVGVSPILAHLSQKRVRFAIADDREVLHALQFLMRHEGIIPALESSHAIACALRELPRIDPQSVVIINLSGRGDKDIFTIAEALQDPGWRRFILTKAEQYQKTTARGEP